MKLISSSFEIINQGPGLIGINKAIELAGRVSHKSENKITKNSAKEFVDKMISMGHGAALEFGTVYLKVPIQCIIDDKNHKTYKLLCVGKYDHNNYSVCNQLDKPDFETTVSGYITTNYRVLVDNQWLEDLKYLCEPTTFHTKRMCVKFTVDRGVSHEIVRHRTFNFLQESTRYCCYSKDKFNNEITCIYPSWCSKELIKAYKSGTPLTLSIDKFCNKYKITELELKRLVTFITILEEIENTYIEMLYNKWTPQEARQVLPNALKTELYVCGFVNKAGWLNFFNLRNDKQHAHPDMYAVVHPLYNEFKLRGLI